MPISEKFTASFEEEKYFHVMCKSIGGQLLFLCDEDRHEFLSRYDRFVASYVDTLAYNLLDNHVHWIIKVKSQTDIFELLESRPLQELTSTQLRFFGGECSMHELIEQQFNRMFISYIIYFNKVHQRKGHLFSRPFRRTEVTSAEYLTRLFVYVHANTLKHGFFKDFVNYPWSSYQIILSDKITRIAREMVLEWFGGRENFAKVHLEMAHAYETHESVEE